MLENSRFLEFTNSTIVSQCIIIVIIIAKANTIRHCDCAFDFAAQFEHLSLIEPIIKLHCSLIDFDTIFIPAI